MLLLAAAAALVLVTRHNKNTGTAAEQSTSTTSTTLPPPPAVQATVAGWKLPVPVRDATAVPGTGNQLLVIGGETGSGASADGVFALNLATGALHQVDALPISVHDAPAAVVGPTVYVLGGSTGTATDAVQTFPLARASSVPGAAKAKSATAATTAVPQAGAAGPLPAPRSGAGVAVVSGNAYVVGGFDGATPEPGILETADGKTFTTVATLPVAVQDAAVAAYGNNIYVFGGYGASATKPVTDVQEINLTTGKATVVAHLPTAVRGASAFLLGQDIYVCGGQGAVIGTGTNRAVWGFNPADNRLSPAGQLTSPVAYAASAVVGGKAWLVAGESGGRPVASAQELTVAAQAPTTAPATGPGKGGAKAGKGGKRT